MSGKKRGPKPSLWHGLSGKEFAAAVSISHYEQRPITKKGAIREVLRRPEFAHFRKYSSMRYLYKQLGDAAEFWSPWPSYKKLFGKASKRGLSTVSTERITETENELVEHNLRPQLFP